MIGNTSLSETDELASQLDPVVENATIRSDTGGQPVNHT